MHADLHTNDRYARTILCSLILLFMVYANLYDNVHAECPYHYQTATGMSSAFFRARMANRTTIGDVAIGRRWNGFYAAVPQLDLNFVLQSCKAFENEESNREIGQTDSCGATAPRSLPNYYSQGREKNTYAKGSLADCFTKPFGCPKCGRSFTIKGNMTRHLKFECGQPPRFQCPYCEFRSKQTSNVMSHIRTRHVGQPVYVVHLEK